MNWLKLITQNGRRALVRETIGKYLTVDKVSQLAADGVSSLLRNSCKDIPDEKMQAICGYCREGGTLFAAIATAVSDKVVTEEEAKEIALQVGALTGGVVTQERVDAIVDAIVEKVP